MVYDLGASTIHARNENRSTTVSTDSDGNVRKEWGDNNNVVVDNTKKDLPVVTVDDTTTVATQGDVLQVGQVGTNGLVYLGSTPSGDPIWGQLDTTDDTTQNTTGDTTQNTTDDTTQNTTGNTTQATPGTVLEIGQQSSSGLYYGGSDESGSPIWLTESEYRLMTDTPVKGTAPVPTGVYKESDGYWYTSSGYKFNSKEEAELAEQLQLEPAPVISTDVLTDTPSEENKPGVLDNLKDTVTDLVSDVFGGTGTPSEENKPGVLDNLKDTVTDIVSDLFPVVSAGEQQPVLDQNLKEAADSIGAFELTPYPYNDKPGTLDKLSAWWNFATADKEEIPAAATNLFLQYGLPDPFWANQEVGRPAAQMVDLIPDKYEDALSKGFPLLKGFAALDDALTVGSIGLTGLRDVLYRNDKKLVAEYAVFTQSGRDVTDLGFFEGLRINKGAAIVNRNLNDNGFLGVVFEDAPAGATINFMGTNLSLDDIVRSRDLQYGDNADLIKDSASDVKYYGWLSDNVLHPFTDVWEIGTGSAANGIGTLYGKVSRQLSDEPPSWEGYLIGAGKTLRSTIVDLPGGIVYAADVGARHRDYFYDNLFSLRYNNQASVVPNFGMLTAGYTNVVNPLVEYAQEQPINEELVGALAAEVALSITGDFLLDAVKYGGKVGKLKAMTKLKNFEIDIRNKHFPLRTDDDLLRDARRRMGKDVDLETAKEFYIDVDRDYPIRRTVEKEIGKTDDGDPITLVTVEESGPKGLHPDAKYEIPKIETKYVEPELVFQGSALEPSLLDRVKHELFGWGEDTAWTPNPYGVTNKGGRMVSETWDDLSPFAQENTRPGKPLSTGEDLVKRKNEYRDSISPSRWDRMGDIDIEIPYSRAAAEGRPPVSYLTHSSSDLLKPKNSAYTVVNIGDSEVGISLYGAKDMMAAPAFTRVAQRKSPIALRKGKKPKNPSVTRIEVDTDQLVSPSQRFVFEGDTLTFEDALGKTKKVRGEFKEYMKMRDAVVDQTGKSVFDTPKYFNKPPGIPIEHEKIIAEGSRLAENPFIRNYTKLGGQMIHLRSQKYVGRVTTSLAGAADDFGGLTPVAGKMPPKPKNLLDGPAKPARDLPAVRDTPSSRDMPTMRDIPSSRDLPAVRDLPAIRDTPSVGGTPRTGPANLLDSPRKKDMSEKAPKNKHGADHDVWVERSGVLNISTLGKTIGLTTVATATRILSEASGTNPVISSGRTAGGSRLRYTPNTTRGGGKTIPRITVKAKTLPFTPGGISPIAPIPGGGTSPISPVPGGGESPVTPVPGPNYPITPIPGGDVIINPLFPVSSRSPVAARRTSALVPPYPGDDDDGPGKKKKKKKGVQPKQKKAKRTNTLINPDAFFGFHLK